MRLCWIRVVSFIDHVLALSFHLLRNRVDNNFGVIVAVKCVMWIMRSKHFCAGFLVFEIKVPAPCRNWCNGGRKGMQESRNKWSGIYLPRNDVRIFRFGKWKIHCISIALSSLRTQLANKIEEQYIAIFCVSDLFYFILCSVELHRCQSFFERKFYMFSL